jgi:hypothetical protein
MRPSAHTRPKWETRRLRAKGKAIGVIVPGSHIRQKQADVGHPQPFVGTYYVMTIYRHPSNQGRNDQCRLDPRRL